MPNGGENPHPYIGNTEADAIEQRKVIGVESDDELFADIPPEHQTSLEDFDMEPGLSEQELVEHFTRLMERNIPVRGGDYLSFLGGSAQDHHIPATVTRFLESRALKTKYTDYQPEASQGGLEMIFNLQSQLRELTGMPVVASSLYDGETATAEAVRMAERLTGRKKVVIWDGVRSQATDTIKTYGAGSQLDIVDGDEETEIGQEVAAVVVQSPNVYGYIEDIPTLAAKTQAVGAKLIVFIKNPLSLGMLKKPAKQGADVVTGDTQVFGIPPSFGGPYNGFLAANLDKGREIRQMPGRIVGATTDVDGKRAFVLTLVGRREQFSGREKATSNICTSQQLIANASSIYLATVGPQLSDIANHNYQNAHYLARQIERIPGFVLPFEGRGQHFFNEFAVSSPLPVPEIRRRLFERKIIAGNDISQDLHNGFTLCATELHRKEHLDQMANALREIAEEERWAA